MKKLDKKRTTIKVWKNKGLEKHNSCFLRQDNKASYTINYEISLFSKSLEIMIKIQFVVISDT